MRAADDVSGTNRVMLIVGIVVLVTFIAVMIIMNTANSKRYIVPSGVKKVTVEFAVKDRGTVKLELRNDLMPKSVNDFVTNIKDGYYVGKKFIRADAFIVSAGFPNDQAGFDVDASVALENNPDLKFDRYMIGMSKNQKLDQSSTKIFFITKARQPDLDGKYAVFGKILDIPSENVIDSIKKDDVITSASIISYDGTPYSAS